MISLSAATHQQQAVLVAHGKFRRKALNDELGLREAATPCSELLAGDILDFVIRLVIFEITVAIALGNARPPQHMAGAVGRGAVAWNRPHHFRFACRRAGTIRGKRLRAFGGTLDNFPAATLADGTICSRHDGSICGPRDARKHTRACANSEDLWKALIQLEAESVSGYAKRDPSAD